MLILSRRVHETIIIADNITIKVLSINGNQVSIGINAPKEVPIYREEIYLRMQEETQLQGVESEIESLVMKNGFGA